MQEDDGHGQLDRGRREAVVVPVPGELPEEDAAEEAGHDLAGQEAPPAIGRQRDRDEGEVAERVQRRNRSGPAMYRIAATAAAANSVVSRTSSSGRGFIRRMRGL